MTAPMQMIVAAAIGAALQAAPPGPIAPVEVEVVRVPHAGIQPQVAVGGDGVVHLVYYSGKPRRGDLWYVRSSDGGASFSEPVRVNSGPGSAVAMGTIRGAHLALGRSGRVHVAWNGAAHAEPRAPGDQAPMLYTRLNEEGTAFEPQRNVIRQHGHLDGGGSVAAGPGGRVYVVWHAPAKPGGGEQDRAVWVATSTDDGATFGPEVRAGREPTGACGCCGLRAFADPAGRLHVLFRSAWEVMNRHTYLLSAETAGGDDFATRKIHDWTVGQCVMSSAAMSAGGDGFLAAWESRGNVFMATVGAGGGEISKPLSAPGRPRNRKHPAVARDETGRTILAWTEGTAFGSGGTVGWQVYDGELAALLEENGHAGGLQPWNLVAVFAKPGGGFVVMY